MLLSKNIINPLILLMLFCVNGNTYSQLSANLNPSGERNILEDRSEWTEIIRERKEYSATYVTPDGRSITHYSKQPLNYYNPNGMLVPVNVTPIESSKGFTAADQPNSVTLLNTGAVEI
nr:hypothetical protein [Bacteroidota bacterium]